jgi:hypothetical protein
MRHFVLFIALGLTLVSGACAPAVSQPPASILPLRTLRIYETGVGYFERAGSLDGSHTSLPVPASHLDDALETLVVLSAGGHSKVTGIEFGSSLSRGMARALAGLPVDAEEPLGLEPLLTGLKGSRIVVKTRARESTGRLVDVVHATADGSVAKAPAADTMDASPTLTLLVLTDVGELVAVRASEVISVRPLDPSYRRRLGSALDALSTRSAQSERLLDVLAQGGPVALGYVAETPVWRATYRLVLDPAGASGTLEGWALLHNDTDEDWRGVKVELANGRPDAFLFPLAAPRYERRQLVTPDHQLATVPQLMGATVDAIWGDQIGDSNGNGGLSLSGVGEGGGGRGEGIGLGSVGTVGHGAGTGTDRSSSLLEIGNLAGVAQASGEEAGALFVYTLVDHVDLRARGSALVPFAQEKISAQAISWIDSVGQPARSAVRFVNSTQQTLPPGTIAFFGDGSFAGESALPRLKPGEERYVTYGQDLDVELTSVPPTNSTDEPKRLVWDGRAGILTEHFLRTSDFAFEIKNRSLHPRSVVLAMGIDANATLTGPDRVEFDAASSRPLAVFVIDAQKKVERRAHAVEGLAKTLTADALTAAWLLEVSAGTSLSASDRSAATEASARLRESEQDHASADQVKNELAELDKDIDRLREHMKALSGEHAGAAQANPFAARILAGEDKLTALRAKQAKLLAGAKAKHEAALGALAKLAS